MCRELDCLSVWGLGETVFCLTKDRRLFWCTEEDWGTKDCLPWKELPIFPPEGYRVGEERDGVKGGGKVERGGVRGEIDGPRSRPIGRRYSVC